MPCIALPIDASHRPIVEIGIAAPSSLLKQGDVRPTIHWIKALADTGCSHTSIHSSIAAKAALKPVGKGSSNTANGAVAVNIFHGDMFIKVSLPTGQVFEYPFRDRRFVELTCDIPDCEALLGMDIFTMGTLHVNGMTKNATFCW